MRPYREPADMPNEPTDSEPEETSDAKWLRRRRALAKITLVLAFEGLLTLVAACAAHDSGCSIFGPWIAAHVVIAMLAAVAWAIITLIG